MTRAIELAGVSKRYRQLEEHSTLLRALLPFSRISKHDLMALSNIEATIDQGETVGVLGRNGSGKTTLLRLLAGVSRPSSGRVMVRGRVAPLISVGVGFHPEMTGRENVYVNAMLLGLSKREISARFDDIVHFAELAKFIDTPVKFYSSGMFMRLGFSVAVHTDPNVLLVDEVLAVGDIAFQMKCVERMRKLQEQGTTILLVTHSMHVIRLMCPRTLLLRRGVLEFDGPSEAAISRHYELLSDDTSEYDEGPSELTAGDSKKAVLVSRSLSGAKGASNVLEPDQPISYTVRVSLGADATDPHVFFEVITETGLPVYGMATHVGRAWGQFEAGSALDVEVRFWPRLGGGTYRLRLSVMDRNGREILWTDPEGTLVYVPPRLGSSGFADLEASISVQGNLLTDFDDPMMFPQNRVS